MTIEKRQHFIRQKIQDDLDSGKITKVITRFPPEPNGFLHIGHAKSICLNFGMKQDFNGQCNLRFDDTNPEKEDQKYIDAIKTDVKWLMGELGDELHYASDYYQKLYDFAIELIKSGKAYVESLSADDMREYRGSLQESGKNSPYRDRTVQENLDLFEGMRAGKFKEGEHILRAKIDMSSGNVNMRDPSLYRIRYAQHPRQGNAWCIYPMYDFAHPLSDALEGITHSLCTLEFQDHRPLYDWCIDNVSINSKPEQTEFARLNISHTITSKRKLKEIVDSGYVTSWHDPRMPTISGMRERGYPAKALRDFCEEIGVSKSESVIDMSILETKVRDCLNESAPRAMCVLKPLKVVITNYDETKNEILSSAKHPNHESMGKRQLPFGRELWIEQDDFEEEPPKKFFRLAPGKEVRLRNSYVIKCEEVIKDDNGEILELRCTYDVNTLGKKPDGRKVKGVIHWVSATDHLPCSLQIFDRLFEIENPAASDNFLDNLNENSLETVDGCFVEKGMLDEKVGTVYQFERQGYFKLLEKGDVFQFHRVVNLKDTWQK